VFGENSPEYRDHQSHEIRDGRVSLPVVGYGEDPRPYEMARQRAFAEGIQRTMTMLRALEDTIDERTVAAPSAGASTAGVRAPGTSRKVFVVHGRKEGPREAVARFLERLRLEPIILQEQANESRTLIEKFERYSDVSYAVVLFTADDRGGPIEEDPSTYLPRARQNAVLELGYFVGKLGRGHVCVLYERGVEIPSDFHGVGYVELDPAGAWKTKLAQEMKAADLDVDMNRVI